MPLEACTQVSFGSQPGRKLASCRKQETPLSRAPHRPGVPDTGGCPLPAFIPIGLGSGARFSLMAVWGGTGRVGLHPWPATQAAFVGQDSSLPVFLGMNDVHSTSEWAGKAEVCEPASHTGCGVHLCIVDSIPSCVPVLCMFPLPALLFPSLLVMGI